MRRTLSALAAAATLVAATAVALIGPAAGPAAAANCPNGYVGLTYDDGPNPSSTNALLNALRSAGVKATFFVQGNHAQQYPDLLRAEANAGMWIGNHSWDHPHLTQTSQSNMQSQLSNTQNVIKSTINQTPKLFRPPYGETNGTLKSVESSLGLTEIIWSHDSQDWNGASTDSIVNTANQMTNGSIILMHDGGYQTTINAVPRIVQNLSNKGLCPGMIQPGTGRVVAPDGGSGTTTTTTTTRATTTTTTTRTTTTTTTSRPGGSTTTTTTTTNGGGNGGGCTATASTSAWNGGYVQNVTVKSSGSTSGWTVSIGVPSGATVTNGWSATFSGSTGTVTATNVSYNADASAGQSFGFQGTGSPSGMTFSCAAG